MRGVVGVDGSAALCVMDFECECECDAQQNKNAHDATWRLEARGEDGWG